jgi:hypothetical protein
VGLGPFGRWAVTHFKRGAALLQRAVNLFQTFSNYSNIF